MNWTYGGIKSAKNVNPRGSKTEVVKDMNTLRITSWKEVERRIERDEEKLPRNII